MKKVIITGSAGFIGFHTALRFLKEGFEVYGIDNLNDYYDPNLKEDRNKILEQDKNFNFIKADISKVEIKNKYCLLYTSPSPRDYGTSRMPSSA